MTEQIAFGNAGPSPAAPAEAPVAPAPTEPQPAAPPGEAKPHGDELEHLAEPPDESG